MERVRRGIWSCNSNKWRGCPRQFQDGYKNLEELVVEEVPCKGLAVTDGGVTVV